MRAAGIYEIVTAANGKRYIGSAVRIDRRFKHHRAAMIRGTHKNRLLQRVWNKYGEVAFEFRVLLLCSRANLLMYEQRCIDELIPEYNICTVATSALGVKRTPETLAKMARASLGNKNAAGHVPSAEARALMAAANVGKQRSPEHRAKISAAGIGNTRCLGRTLTVEHRGKIATANKGKVRSTESREKYSAIAKVRKYSHETRAKISASKIGNTSHFGHKHSVGTRAKISASQRARHAAKAVNLQIGEST